jgi:hypothetical protein
LHASSHYECHLVGALITGVGIVHYTPRLRVIESCHCICSICMSMGLGGVGGGGGGVVPVVQWSETSRRFTFPEHGSPNSAAEGSIVQAFLPTGVIFSYGCGWR